MTGLLFLSSPRRGAVRPALGIVILGLALGAVWFIHQAKSSTSGPAQASVPISGEVDDTDSAAQAQTALPSRDERQVAFEQAMAGGSKLNQSWPATPQALVTDFWQAAHEKNYDRMVLLCPGSVRQEYEGYYGNFTPSPAKAVGAPGPHPLNPDIQLYPVTVSFPGFPEKTIKMAVVQAGDGRWVIDGQHTIWW